MHPVYKTRANANTVTLGRLMFFAMNCAMDLPVKPPAIPIANTHSPNVYGISPLRAY